ncbi:EpsG family protein [Caballeronia ptereochthonis]|uniref:EpsG family protein n=1 Tax=Caballeronia ptereochthonis TaxID=1777144 RepID=A0A158B1D8_9BURK|nr:EpsG family protein [Caballeronia ptereochthonis]SAK63740.1 hypothetical protein AWB83_02618 [Caballeronia ptereochthonis]
MKNLALRKNSASMGASRTGSGEPPYLLTPAGWAFVLLASYVIWFLVTSGRPVPTLPDQDSYLEYFQLTGPDWFSDYVQRHPLGLGFIPRIITDELGWRLWIILVNWFGFTPDGAIRLTVGLANGLVFCSLARLRRPLLGLVLWIVIPTALAVTGLYQIRQGFAFGVAMMFCVVLRRPVLGLLIASTIHTTMAFPAILLIVARLSGPNNRIAIPAVGIAGALLSLSAPMLFDAFGGRRIADYAGYQAEFSVNLLVLMLSYCFASALLIMSIRYVRPLYMRSPLRELGLMHLGLIAYLVCAFLFFPFGKDRVFYLISLLLPFFLQEIRVRSTITLWMTAVLYVMIMADVYLAYQKGVFYYFVG